MTDTDEFDSTKLAELFELERLTGMSLVAGLLAAYLDALPERIAEIRAAVAAGDSGGQRLAAHSLKGGSLQLGAVAVAAVCQRLELASPEEAEPLLVQLERLLPAVQAYGARARHGGV